MKKIGLLIETNADGIKPAMNGVITAARGPEHELYGLVLDGKGAGYREALQDYGIHKIRRCTISTRGIGLESG